MDKKSERILCMYTKLMDGHSLQKDEEATRFGVTRRTIQRDLDDIRAYLANDYDYRRHLVYDKSKNHYILIKEPKTKNVKKKKED